MNTYIGKKLVVFTDLDGTLLDHHTYAFSSAQTALDHLKKNEIPLVINTSKTFDEVMQIRKSLNNDHPFIAENGSVSAVPETYFSHKFFRTPFVASAPMNLPLVDMIDGMQVFRLGGDRNEILDIIGSFRKENGFHFTGFEDMDAEALSKVTGLSLPGAVLAKKRMCTEPILWQDTDEAWRQFKLQLVSAGLQWVQGGRFISISRPYDKKDGVLYLMDLYKKAFSGQDLVIIGLGDSPNDQGMLELADIAVIIHSDRSADVKVSKPTTVIRTVQKGPAGWQAAMEQIFDMCNI